jgi:Prokaryotic Cytochrome C oxidase subunit IV
VSVETRFNMRLFVVWLILVGITVAYLGIDRSVDDHGIATASTAVTVAAICLALIKVRIIMREFMEVRGAHQVLCRLTDFWVVLMGVAMLGVYLAGRAVA